jgi:CBS domain-containing protein
LLLRDDGRSIAATGKTGRLCVTAKGVCGALQTEELVMQVRHILQIKGRDIIGIADTATLGDAARILAQHHVGALIIQDSGGALTGIFSERDLVRAVAEDGPLALSRAVADYMSRQVTSCREDDTVEDLMEMMTRGRFRHVPVLGEGQRLAGMISIGDVVKSRIAETQSEANSLRDYISATV